MEKITRQVTLTGIRPIMFDRFPGSMKAGEALAPIDKLYMVDQTIVLPAVNILSFLSSQNTESAPQRVIGRGWKAVAKAALSFIDIDPLYIPITREGNEMTIESSGVVIHNSVARIKKGALSIPSVKERPLIGLPWEVSFKITLFKNPDLNEPILRRLFDEGGLSIGLGTFRGVFGKFEITKWE
jgi:hypothetical protein